MSDDVTMRAANCCRTRKFGTILFNLPRQSPRLDLLIGRAGYGGLATGEAIRLKLESDLIQLP